jgi:hypothetical protein
MTNRTTSILLASTVLIAILGVFLLPLGQGLGVVSRFISYGYVLDIFAVWFFLAVKICSALAPLNFKWESLSRNENMFCFFYVFLTKEAREEWRGYIGDKKN